MNNERFRTPVDFRYIDGYRWEILTTVVYDTPTYPGDSVTIPAGSTTDFASIPKFLWNILPPTGQYGLAAVVHDRLWNHPVLDSGQKLSPLEVDDIFNRAMKELDVPDMTRLTIYFAVRGYRELIRRTK